MTRRSLLLLAAAAVSAGCAQSAPSPEPALPAAKTPAVEYRSAFDAYHAFADDKPVFWREANETVKEEGDHGAHGASKPAAEGAR